MRVFSQWMKVLLVALLMTMVLGISASASDDDGYGDFLEDYPEIQDPVFEEPSTSAPEETEAPTTAAPEKRKKVYYDLTVSSTDGGSVPGFERTATYEKGTRVNMLAVAEEGYEFVGWALDASGEDLSIRLIMDGDKEAKAIFEAIIVEVSETVVPETTAAEILDEATPESGPEIDIAEEALPQTAGIPVALVVTFGSVVGFAGLSLRKKTK